MSVDETPPRGGDLDPLDGAGAVVVPVVIALVAVIAAACTALLW